MGIVPTGKFGSLSPKESPSCDRVALPNLN